MIVVSDTSPICYLVLTIEIELLHKLYGQVLIPKIVQQELLDEHSPLVVRNWLSNHPKWLVIHNVKLFYEDELEVIFN